MGQQRSQEGDIRLDAADSELYQRTEHFPSSDLVGRPMAGALYQHGIVMGGDNSTRETITTI